MRRWLLLVLVGVTCGGRIATTQELRGPDAARRALENGSYASADDLATRWLADVESRSPSDSAALSNAIAILVEARAKNGKGGATSTLALAERAIALRRTQRPRDDAALADSLDQLAQLLIPLERFQDAKLRVDEALRIRRAIPADERGLARTLEVLGTWHRYAGSYVQSVAPLDQALAIRRRLTPVHPDTAQALLIRGDVFLLMGNSADAQRTWLEALSMAEKTLGPNHPAIAEFLRRVSFANFAAGRLADARRLRERALRIGRSLPACDPAFARLLNSLALSLQYDGEYFEAQRLYQQALATSEKCVGATHSDYATYVFNDAALAREIGDLGEAERLYTQSIAVWSKGLGPTHDFVARGLDALAEVAALQGQLPRARSLYEQALTIHRSKLGPVHPQVAWTLTNLAKTIADAGDVPTALQQVEQAIAIFQKSGASDEPDHFARVLELRGVLEARRGNLAAARTSLAAALTERERIFGTVHPLAAETRAAVANVDFARGAYGEALGAALTAERAGRDHLRFTARYLPERQAMAYADKRPRGLDLALSITAAGVVPDPSRVFDAFIQSRGLVLDELAARARSANGRDGRVGALNTKLIAARQRFANLVVRSLREPVPRALLDEARQQKEEAERAVAEGSAARLELTRASTNLADIQRALPANATLVSFVRYGRTIASDAAQKPPTPSYAAFVIRGGSRRVTFVPLGAASTVDALIRAWRDEASGQSQRVVLSAAQAEAAYRSTADRVRQAVWDPLDAATTGSAMIFIVPDGDLNLVNISALTDGQGRYLLERESVIHHLSTERDLVSPMARPASAKTLLAVGGAAFDDRDGASGRPASSRAGCDALAQLRFNNLPGSLREVTEIGEMWPAFAGRPTILTGRSATETAVKNALTDRRVVHFATHGFFLGDDCPPVASGSRAIGGAPASARKDQAIERVPDNPLLLSGLAFAGANRGAAARPDEDDGILMAEEVVSLNLTGVEWAVLSACGTGLGEIKAGEGVFGLRRAFQIAGARTVIMSLWSVDDQATREWMRALYDGRFKKGLDTAHAVHAASLTVLRERRAKGLSTLPFYWAAFVAAGDWR
ncbi:MAG TPA: CHAT domain-containing tetratricopeptide repeat protein [Vicinamibacterales bacterium]